MNLSHGQLFKLQRQNIVIGVLSKKIFSNARSVNVFITVQLNAKKMIGNITNFNVKFIPKCAHKKTCQFINK